MTHTPALEIKSADLNDAFDGFMRTFEAYKDHNDDRLDKIEKRSGDVLAEEKMARLDRALDDAKRVVDHLALKAQRPQLGTNAPRSAADREHKTAFDSYMRRGDATAITRIEQKALTANANPDGGYTVPVEIEASINHALRAISPIRAIAGNRQVSASVYRKPYATSGFPAGWVGETDVRPQTVTPQLAEMAFPTMELYAMPAASMHLLDDSAVNIDQWIADEVRITFAQQEGAAFVTGTGVNTPKGFLAYPTVDNASWSHGSIGTIKTGVAGAFPTLNPYDKLIDLIHSLKAPYRANGSFVMNRTTQAAVRKMKDSTGDYLWEAATAPGVAPTLMGYPVVEAEDMPDPGTDSLSVAFGDFNRGYLVVDRIGIRMLRDPYSAKPYVLFYTTKRVGGGVQDFDAIKLLKFSA
jgi:HK97 family phage major capsid protein